MLSRLKFGPSAKKFVIDDLLESSSIMTKVNVIGLVYWTKHGFS